MDSLLYTFIYKCDKVNLLPSESHIDMYLKGCNRLDLRTNFIKFCFYNWEIRKDADKVEAILNSI